MFTSYKYYNTRHQLKYVAGKVVDIGTFLLIGLLMSTCVAAVSNAESYTEQVYTDKDVLNNSYKAKALFEKIDSTPQPTKSFNLKGKDLVRAVNNYVNFEVTWKADDADYWQSPDETSTLGTGDCEDFAIYKMQLLRNSGVPDKDMYIIIGTTAKGEYHAILRVNIDGVMYYMDNQTTSIIASTMVNPIYAVNRFTFNRFILE